MSEHKGKQKAAKSTLSMGSHDAQFPEASIDPRRVEKFTMSDGLRMTRLIFRDGKDGHVERPADDLFAMAKKYPEAFVGHLPLWHFILPWLKNSADDVGVFWLKFNTSQSFKNRIAAVEGAGSAKRASARSMIGVANEIHGLRQGSGEGKLLLSGITGGEHKLAIEDEGLKRLGEWLLNAIINNPSDIRKLHEMLSGDSQETFPTKEGKIFIAFMRYVGENERLPTKKWLRDIVGIKSNTEDYKVAREAFKRLGLSGLPKGG